jgi:aminopeptidase-like protein
MEKTDTMNRATPQAVRTSIHIGPEMFQLVKQLYPLCRSITGDGVRETLRVLQGHIPLLMREVPSGTDVFDWKVPREWNIRDAYVKDPAGHKIIDFTTSNLHVVSYSIPVKRRMSLEELRKHLFTLPEHPEWIPYRTSYYAEDWGFCLSHRQLTQLQDGEYEVMIDSSLENGHLTYGELCIPGETLDEVLVSTHVCHPSLCNDNLSGVVLTTFLAKLLSQGRPQLRYSYRFLFIPGTIGSITWLCLNEGNLSTIKHGLVASCLGDPGRFTYKKSRQGNAEVDRAVVNVLKHAVSDYEISEFTPYGYDERQYCSPAFNLPVGCLTRTPNGRFPQYHTSADDLEFIKSEWLAESLSMYLAVVDVLEKNKTYVNTNPKGEPQLGRRGLYRQVGGAAVGSSQLAMLWVLNLSDGGHSLLEISERSGLPFSAIHDAASMLLQHGLLRPKAE